MRTLALISMCLLLSFMMFGQDPNPQEIFDEANVLFESGEYNKAIEKFQSIYDLGYISAKLNYNLGTAHLKTGNIGQSVLFLERAHLLSPSDNNISHNLGMARSLVDSDIIEIPDFILVRLWRAFASMFSPTIWLVVQIFFAGLAIFGVYLWQLKDNTKLKMRGFLLFISASFLLLISIASGFSADKMMNQSESAILLMGTVLKSGPDDRANSIADLSEGIKVKVSDQIDDWYKVQLINKEVGWISKNALELI